MKTFLIFDYYFFFFVVFFLIGKATSSSNPGSPAPDWYKDFVTDADAEVLEHSGKMVLLFEILRMAEELGDKVWVLDMLLKFRSILVWQCSPSTLHSAGAVFWSRTSMVHSFLSGIFHTCMCFTAVWLCLSQRSYQREEGTRMKMNPEMNSVFSCFFFQPCVQPVPNISGFDRRFPGTG